MSPLDEIFMQNRYMRPGAVCLVELWRSNSVQVIPVPAYTHGDLEDSNSRRTILSRATYVSDVLLLWARLAAPR
jgi:hypothetical protein